jgi:hypothetical protein
VAQTCYPSLLGGRDHEDHSSKPARARSSDDPHLKEWLHTMVLTYHPSYIGNSIKQNPVSKITNTKRASRTG